MDAEADKSANLSRLVGLETSRWTLNLINHLEFCTQRLYPQTVESNVGSIKV